MLEFWQKMKTWQRALASVVGAVLVLLIIGYTTFKLKNPPAQLAEPNYFEYYKNQDTKPEGKVGIFISGLYQPEDFRMGDFYNVSLKAKQYIPWPFKEAAFADRGVVLLDTKKFYEFEEFTPTKLVDFYMRDKDIDGIPYADKYKTGEVKWVPPNPSQHLDHGYFILDNRKGGMPTSSQKFLVKAQVFYYGSGFVNGKVPHEHGSWQIAKKAIDKIQRKYGDIPYRFISAENFYEARNQMRSLLDEGVDTVVLAPGGVIYSHHEVFNGSVLHAMHYIHEWEKENDKHIKVIISPQLGNYPIARQAHLTLLKERLDTLPNGADVKVVISMHGMAWDLVPLEAWIQLSPAYADALTADADAMLKSYDFGRTETVLAQDHFGDDHSDPRQVHLSTNEAFWDGVNDGYDIIVHVPGEFFSENTDTMFYHAMANFEYFDDFDLYTQIDYPDWNKPFTTEYTQDGTRVIYNGVPAGDYNEPVAEAYARAMDSVLSQGLTPIRDSWQIAAITNN